MTNVFCLLSALCHNCFGGIHCQPSWELHIKLNSQYDLQKCIQLETRTRRACSRLCCLGTFIFTQTAPIAIGEKEYEKCKMQPNNETTCPRFPKIALAQIVYSFDCLSNNYAKSTVIEIRPAYLRPQVVLLWSAMYLYFKFHAFRWIFVAYPAQTLKTIHVDHRFIDAIYRFTMLVVF